jgi:hypothetical protein
MNVVFGYLIKGFDLHERVPWLVLCLVDMVHSYTLWWRKLEICFNRTTKIPVNFIVHDILTGRGLGTTGAAAGRGNRRRQ